MELNEAGEKPNFEEMVEKDDSKDTFACDDDVHKVDMCPESHVLW